ncbi:MAG TPA: dipeptidase, partial [Candidatus Saccharimonadales bacterium]|nr:dipeptidase [Candidatus Saccharimonadales bacterium]
HNADTRKCAEWVKNKFEQAGLENSQILETGGQPIVYADYLHAEGHPTVLVYGHYDVQSPDPLDEWKSAPFEPEVRDGKLYARGADDNKGQFFAHLKALELLIHTDKRLPVNVKFMVEGEEEIGGVHLDSFIESHLDLLKADVCLISDSHSLSVTQPLINYGLRGLVYTELTLSALDKDVHSGEFGGNVPNVAIELANIISKLKDPVTQKVLVDGFYDNVRQVSHEEMHQLEHSPFTERFVLEETGASRLIGEEGFLPPVRMGARPTLDVNGMSSGYILEGSKTIIPSKAMAKISLRIVPNQTSAEIAEKFTNFVRKIVPRYVNYIDVKILSTGEPILMDISSHFFKHAETVLEEVFGNKPVYDLSGGSIPVTATLKKLLGIDSILMGFGLPDDGLHSPNEKMDVEMFYKGIKSSTLFFRSLGL